MNRPSPTVEAAIAAQLLQPQSGELCVILAIASEQVPIPAALVASVAHATLNCGGLWECVQEIMTDGSPTAEIRSAALPLIPACRAALQAAIAALDQTEAALQEFKQ